METTLRGLPIARRDHRSVLAAREKQLLIWIAQRLPRWIHSDHLTAIGFVGILAAGSGYALGTPGGWWLAIGGLLVNWFGDSLDGTLARVRNQQRPRYGFYVDHILDAAGTMALLAGLAISGVMTPLVAAALLSVYFLLCIEVGLATHALGVFRMAFVGCGPTELRLALIAGNLALLRGFYSVQIYGERYRIWDVGAGVAMVAMVVIVIATAVRNARTLYRAEPLP